MFTRKSVPVFAVGMCYAVGWKHGEDEGFLLLAAFGGGMWNGKY